MSGSWAGKRVLVCGAGVAGAPAAQALLDRGAEVSISDQHETEAVAGLIARGARFVGAITTAPSGIDFAVTGGWPPDHPLLASVQAAGIPVIGEVELAWRLRGPHAAPWLAVTGTNGKTTTVRMLESILRAAGNHALAVGNVGVSIVDAVTGEHAYDVLAVELSSFQMHWSSTVVPAAGALLNLAPDHIDWHGSMAAYAMTKTRVWDGPIAIGNLDDDQVKQLLLDPASRAQGRRIGFTLGRPRLGELGVIDGMLVDFAFSTDARTPVVLIPAADIRPAGQHNIGNALAAAALARAYGVPAAAVATGLREFSPDPHRNQLVANRSGICFVDDSKATNPHAAAASLASYERIVWIAGGQLKGAPVDELVSSFGDRLRGAVLLGVDRAEIADSLSRHAPDVPIIDVARTDDKAMIEVVRGAVSLAQPGDTVLLAPAAASYDMFSGYSARAAAFAAAIDEVLES